MARESLATTGLSMSETSIKALLVMKRAETSSNVLVPAAMHAPKVSILLVWAS
jgi:hypothetical protein